MSQYIAYPRIYNACAICIRICKGFTIGITACMIDNAACKALSIQMIKPVLHEAIRSTRKKGNTQSELVINKIECQLIY